MPGSRVLIVDDDPAIRKVLSTSLEMEGYELEIATDGQEGLEKISGGPPDLVILDIMMPRVDGLTMLRSMRADPTTASIPVILLTAKSSQEDQWEGWRTGVDYYMTKPFDIEELLRFMKYVLDGGDKSNSE